MSVVIRIVNLVGFGPTAETNRYAMDFDIAAHNGRGLIPTTADISQAKHFATASDALEFWRTPSRVRPLRPDGGINRPMTAFTVEIVPI